MYWNEMGFSDVESLAAAAAVLPAHPHIRSHNNFALPLKAFAKPIHRLYYDSVKLEPITLTPNINFA